MLLTQPYCVAVFRLPFAETKLADYEKGHGDEACFPVHEQTLAIDS